jgi:hypothetical protein
MEPNSTFLSITDLISSIRTRLYLQITGVGLYKNMV